MINQQPSQSLRPLTTVQAESVPRPTLLVGAVSAIVGPLLALAANVLQPSIGSAHVHEVIYNITQVRNWSALHLSLIVGLLFILAALTAVTLSMDGEPGHTVARFALLAALLGGALLLVSTAIDGFAVNQLARSWQLAPVDERTTALRITAAVMAVEYAVNSLGWIVLVGLGTFLYGLAITLGNAYPRLLGWLAIALGTGTFIVGWVQAFNGPGSSDTEVVAGALSVLALAWVFVMGLVIWRKARHARKRNAEEAPRLR
jgi:hypothetical protein